MASDSPLLSLSRLRRVLGLDDQASTSDLEREAHELLARLEHRRESDGDESLEREISALSSSVDRWTKPAPAAPDAVTPSPNAAADGAIGRARGLARTFTPILLGILVAGIAAYGMGFRVSRLIEAPQVDEATTARLIIESRPRGAELRVRPPDQEELLLKIPADGVRLELDAGLYDLEVSREDCPDPWQQTLDLRGGETRHFEPTVCRGEAQLVVRSNVSGDRLRIDGFDFGATGAAPHTLSVGDHTVQVDKQGYLPFDGKVRLSPDETLELRADLVALEPGPARKGRPLPFAVVPPSRPPQAGPQAGGPTNPIQPLDLDLDLEAPPVGVPSRLLDLEGGRGDRPRGGSTTWHDAVSRQLLGRFDSDGSGSIDRVEESEAIPCDLWVEIERDFDEGGLGLSMSRNYGFDGSEWIDGALGFSRSIRSAVYEKMLECGLQP